MMALTLFAWGLLGLAAGMFGLIAWTDRPQAHAQRGDI